MTDTRHTHAVDLPLAIEFLNTLALHHGVTVDEFTTGGQAIGWLAAHGLVHGEAVAGTSEEAALARVRRTRAALREVVAAAREGRSPSGETLEAVNRTLLAREIVQIVPADEGLRLDHRHADDPLDDALARLAEPLVREITEGHPERLRTCADETCRWVFHDESPSGRRRWCDMASCGNRAKAARHRARRKDAGLPALAARE